MAPFVHPKPNNKASAHQSCEDEEVVVVEIVVVLFVKQSTRDSSLQIFNFVSKSLFLPQACIKS
jgi:hypothetical protein